MTRRSARSWRAVGLALALAGCATAPQDRPAAVEPAVPAVPQTWHAFLVAGSVSEPVFDNFIAAFGGILDTQGVQVARFSSRSPIPASAALATQENLRRHAIAGATPDVGCLIYFTSHGVGGAMEMAADRANRGRMGAATLAITAAMICGERPSVVVLSGCYAGSLMSDLLATENRVVIAAARKDRPSFGCSSRRQFHFFDACFLESWTGSQDWRGLFAATKSCVARLEAAERVAPSEPQAFFGQKTAGLALPAKTHAPGS